MIHIKSFSDFKKMPWKNELGVTSEISIFPSGSEIEKLNFDWRLSAAYIEKNSEFSLYSGYERKLTVLKGEGLLLKKKFSEELKKMHQIHFLGEERIYCELIESKPVLDLGVIYKPDKVKCEIQFYEDSKTQLLLNSGIHFVAVLSGIFLINDIEIKNDDFVQIQDEPMIKLQSIQEKSQLVLVSIYTK